MRTALAVSGLTTGDSSPTSLYAYMHELSRYLVRAYISEATLRHVTSHNSHLNKDHSELPTRLRPNIQVYGRRSLATMQLF
jgi:hypothetical protein